MPETDRGYTPRHFNPTRIHRPPAIDEAGDARSAPVYVYNEDIVLAINVAIATRRPILVRGPSGSGKSSLARNVADVLGWGFYDEVITSHTRARDLLWNVDLVRRLHDAYSPGSHLTTDYAPYVVPGVLWWAFDRSTAARLGNHHNADTVERVDDPAGVDRDRAVVLLDEIDKADPDVPNNLLVPLGSLQFVIEETGFTVRVTDATAPLVFLTTNEERDLPPAFLRRCVELRLELPTRARLLEIAAAHFPDTPDAELAIVAEKVLGPATPEDEEIPVPISPAEFIDTVRAKQSLEVDFDSPTWTALTEITAWKHGRTREL